MSSDLTESPMEQRRLALLERLAAVAARDADSSAAAAPHRGDPRPEPVPAGSLQLTYWRNLLQRAGRQRAAVARRLLDKAEAAMMSLEQRDGSKQGRGERERGERERGAADLTTRAGSPDGHPRAQQWLVQLMQDLSPPELPTLDTPEARLQAAMAEQERRFWLALGGGPSEPAVPRRQQGLQAARELGATRARFQLDQLVATALVHQPEFPGPLNPQRLLVRLLTRLHDVSPAYLIRTLEQTRTVFELQRGGETESPPRGGRKTPKTRSPG